VQRRIAHAFAAPDAAACQAISHRAGLCSGTPGALVVLRLLYLHYTRGWLAGWDAGAWCDGPWPCACTRLSRAALLAGVAWMSTLRPEWRPGTQAAYHHVSWSFVVGGIAAGAAGRHVRDVVAECLAAPLDAARDMHVGVLPPAERHRVAPLVRPGLAQLWRATRAAAPALSLLATCLRVLAAWLEALLMCAVFNSALFASVCLPSSNGFWTAHAVARMYGALANGGAVELPDGAAAQLLAPDALTAVVRKVRDDARVPSPREGRGVRALNSLGFTPWPGAVHTGGAAGVVLGHGGMGGSVAFADVERGLSVAVLKTGYTPIALSQTATCAAVLELADVIRAHC
jgi:CubicO group peptidase (beta-lactamase class C family)